MGMGEFDPSRDTPFVADSYKRFIADLKVAGVKGLALLAIDETPGPGILFLEIMMDIVPENETCISAFDQVIDAESKFSQTIEGFGLPVSMAFVNTAGTTIADLEPKIRARWERDSDQLLEFIKF